MALNVIVALLFLDGWSNSRCRNLPLTDRERHQVACRLSTRHASLPRQLALVLSFLGPACGLVPSGTGFVIVARMLLEEFNIGPDDFLELHQDVHGSAVAALGAPFPQVLGLGDLEVSLRAVDEFELLRRQFAVRVGAEGITAVALGVAFLDQILELARGEIFDQSLEGLCVGGRWVCGIVLRPADGRELDQGQDGLEDVVVNFGGAIDRLLVELRGRWRG